MASQDDAETILNINLHSIYESCSEAYGLSALQRWIGNRTAETFRKNIDGGQILIAESSNEPVGFFDVVLHCFSNKPRHLDPLLHG